MPKSAARRSGAGLKAKNGAKAGENVIKARNKGLAKAEDQAKGYRREKSVAKAVRSKIQNGAKAGENGIKGREQGLG